MALQTALVPSETFIPLRVKLGVEHGMLNCLVAEVTLDGTSVFASAGKLKAFGVAQHVRMHRKVDAGHFAGTSDNRMHLTR